MIFRLSQKLINCGLVTRFSRELRRKNPKKHVFLHEEKNFLDSEISNILVNYLENHLKPSTKSISAMLPNQNQIGHM